MMPGRGVGGLGSVTLGSKSGIRNPEIQHLSLSPRLFSVPRPDWVHAWAGSFWPPVSVHWVPGALESHTTLRNKVRFHLRNSKKD